MTIGKREQARREQRYRALKVMRVAAESLLAIVNDALENELYQHPQQVPLRREYADQNYNFWTPMQVAIEEYNRLLTEHGIASPSKAEG